MKHPFWILNSAIASLLVGVFLFIMLSTQEVPERSTIEPEVSHERIKQDNLKINISKIYENDIFNTYVKKAEPAIAATKEIPLPPPPQPVVAKIPEKPKVEFLDPLNITLKGIVIVANDPNKSRAIIQDNDTKRETIYKIGNMITDAQIIRILKNKVIFLRSNGQQEVLYLREKDALSDPTYTALINWSKIVRPIENNYLAINVTAFTERVQNISQFIDMLDLTTAYQKGQSVGCRIGKVNKDSLGTALGLQTGDVIVTVDDISAADTNHRFQIYKNVTNKKVNEPIVVKLVRNGATITLGYLLEEFNNFDTLESKTPAQELNAERAIKEKQLNTLQKKHNVTAMTQDINKRERQNMLSRGNVPVNRKSAETA